MSVGVAGGGTKSNVIPAQAWAEVDVRIARQADGPRIERKFAALKAADPRCSLTVIGGINRPPMERRRGTVRLFHRAQALATDLGFALDEASTGGASDGNFTAALGIPTLDGMGAVGEGAHARHESVAPRAPRPAHRTAGRHAVVMRRSPLRTIAPDKLASRILLEIPQQMKRFALFLSSSAITAAAGAQTATKTSATGSSKAKTAATATAARSNGTI